MKAKVGDHIVVKGRTVTVPDRECEVIEVRGGENGPPFKVRWLDDGHEGLFFPGSDASIMAKQPKRA